MNWEDRLKEQVRRKFDNYAKQRIDLATARTNQLITLAGEFLYVENASSPQALATIRLNADKNSELNIRQNTVIETIFTCFYLSNTAQAGQWIDIVCGVDFEKSDLPSSEIATVKTIQWITNALPNVSTQGSNTPCRQAMIVCDVMTCTGGFLVNFKTAANPANPYKSLYPGESLTVNIQNLNEINILFAIGGEKATIIYES